MNKSPTERQELPYRQKRKWKYSDMDMDTGLMIVQCYDCGLSYDTGCGWCDVIIPNEIWELINPTNHKGVGLLCFNCIARRLEFLGLEDVPIAIVSGPFKKNKREEV